MTLKLVMLPEAKRNLRKAADWYDRQSEGRGKLFLEAVNVHTARDPKFWQQWLR